MGKKSSIAQAYCKNQPYAIFMHKTSLVSQIDYLDVMRQYKDTYKIDV